MVVDREPLDRWVEAAMKHAELEMLPGGLVFARVPGCAGTGDDAGEARRELRGVLYDPALIGLRLDDEIPVIGG